MKKYPMWFKVGSDAYKTKKDFGATAKATIDIEVKASAAVTLPFAQLEVIQSSNKLGGQTFGLYLDGTLIRRTICDYNGDEVK